MSGTFVATHYSTRYLFFQTTHYSTRYLFFQTTRYSTRVANLTTLPNTVREKAIGSRHGIPCGTGLFAARFAANGKWHMASSVGLLSEDI